VAADCCGDVEAAPRSAISMLRTLESFQPPLLQLSEEDDPSALSVFQRAPQQKKKQRVAVAVSQPAAQKPRLID
jgi:hypothetical protein